MGLDADRWGMSEMNDYVAFRRAILERSERCGAGVESPGKRHRRHCEAVVAATAQVVAEKGIGWCESHPDELADAVMSQLSVLARVVSWLLAIFIPGGPIWLSVIQWALPIIADYLTSVEAAALCGASGEELGRQAAEFLKGI
jgi:hypothetical protein